MRRTVLYFILFFQVMLIISLVRGTYETLKSRERIAKLEEQRTQLEERKRELEEKMAEVTSPGYLEKVAREELHLSRPGETVVIVPDKLRVGETVNHGGEDTEEKANWQKWWEVVSGKME